MKLAIYAITRNGGRQGELLKRELPFADLFVTEAAYDEQQSSQLLALPLSGFVAPRFNDYDGHIFICASGIVSRVIGPLLQDKRSDPAVVCVDEQAKFAISMLSGHRGGANELTERVAHIIKAMPVITTASDVSESVAVDMLGAPFGWVLDPLSEPSITPVSAAVVNEQPVLVAQEAGDKSWWKYEKRMPGNILCHTSLDGADSKDFHGAILISDRRLVDVGGWENRLVLWRPKSLVLGLGCDRNTPLHVLKAGLEAFSRQFNLSLDSVREFASIDLKADETGLIQLSEQKQWRFTTFAPEQLDGIEGIENPSDYVRKVTGSNSVAEAAALKLCNSSKLLVPKWTFKQDGFNMTIACCRREFSESLTMQKRKNWLGQKKHNSEASQDEKEPKTQEIKVNTYSNEVLSPEGFAPVEGSGPIKGYS